MSWTDHDFNQSKFGHGPAHPIRRLLSGSVPVGTAAGARIRIHVSLFWFVGLLICYSATYRALGWRVGVTAALVLCPLVLLHELGHALASRGLGGTPEDIVLWPLGGLASHHAPARPRAQIAVALAGPLVNLIVCIIAGGVLVSMGLMHRETAWNPLSGVSYFVHLHGAPFVLGWVFLVSWMLMLCNLLPILPLDGSCVVQALLRPAFGTQRALSIGCAVGMVGAIALGVTGSFFPARWAVLLLAFLLYLYCFRQRLLLRHAEAEVIYSADDYRAGAGEPRRRRRKLSRRLIARCRRRAEKDRAELERVDLILAKVSAQGINSLTWMERHALHKATERHRRAEAELLADYHR